MIELVVYENGTIYLNGYRVKGRKVYFTENIKFKTYNIEEHSVKKAFEKWIK